MAHYSNGRRILRSFASYPAAKEAAESTVREPGERFSRFGLERGAEPGRPGCVVIGSAAISVRRASAPSLNATVGEYIEALRFLPDGVSLLEAVRSFRENTASVTQSCWQKPSRNSTTAGTPGRFQWTGSGRN